MPMTLPDRPDPADFHLEPDSPLWPGLWREIAPLPAGVQGRGDPGVLATPSVAIVGTRRPTPRGLAFARGLAARLAAAGWTIVSGLARGIDAAAHQGALDVGGRTVAVMATGSDRTYPRNHLALRAAIEERGCSVTEFPPGAAPLPAHFPQRNRLIAGLALGVVVVEAPAHSGAMNTAWHAVDFDREVFAVPGPVETGLSRGCHRLLRQGAHLVESAADVAEVLGQLALPLPVPARPLPQDRLDPHGAAAWIFARLDLEGVLRDELRDRWPLAEDLWQEGLLDLEVAGLIRRLPGGLLARSIWSD